MPINILPLDQKNLYRKETYTDDKSGSVVEHIPILIDEQGLVIFDPIRTIQYKGLTYLNSQPIEFLIKADSLKEAINNFVPACSAAIQELQSQAIQDQITRPMQQNGRLIIDPKRRS